MTQQGLRLSAGVLVAAAVATGIAYAMVPGPGGIFTACMLNNVGTIRLIDKSLPATSWLSRCKPGFETEISWNQTGPQGERGIQGVPGNDGLDGINGTNGRDGVDGAPGAAAGFSAGANSSPTLNFSRQTVVAMSLPAGKYLLNGKVRLANFTAIDAGMDCMLRLNAGLPFEVSDGIVHSNGGILIVPLVSAAQLTNPATIDIACDASGPIIATNATLTATQVATLNGQ